MRRAFTLIEMLVVIGVIAVLVALLVPAASMAVARTRNYTMSSEISQLSQAIERYKNQMGDYPPSMGEDYSLANRYNTVAERHLRKCYPKIDRRPGGNADFFYTSIAPRLSGDEALVFWLSLVQNNEREPFNPTGTSPRKFHDFQSERLTDDDGDSFPSYKAAFAGETPYVYLDSRTYQLHQFQATSISGVQPYGDYAECERVKALLPPTSPQEIIARKQRQYMNPTTFQIICAGQDKEFGPASDQFDAQGYARTVPPNFPSQPYWEGLRQFRTGIAYNDPDNDNLANFAEGRRLGDHIP